MLLLAPFLQNPGQEPMPDVAVWIEGNIIRYAGPRTAIPGVALADPEKYSLEDCVLFPGLVNAHCHLELSALADLSYPGNFVDWIRKVLAAKNNLDFEDQRKSLTKGILLSLLGGTTTVGDHISFNGDLEGLLASPLRGKIFIEVLGVVKEIAHDLLEAALSLRHTYNSQSSRFEIIPSPHSVHALVPAILDQMLRQPEAQLFSLHLAESESEQQYFANHTGDLQDLIFERGQALDRPHSSAVQELATKKLLDSRILAIHGNYLERKELKLLAEAGCSLVHCPLSHRYFGHKIFPMEEALALGINVVLGTDSLASASSLSMLEVMRQTQESFPELAQKDILKMATQGGTRALKMEKEIGEVVPGKKADLVGVSMGKNTSPLEAIFAAEQVSFCMIDGKMIAG